jgi:RNA polymerase sigma-70 factor (ECF subfamily)
MGLLSAAFQAGVPDQRAWGNRDSGSLESALQELVAAGQSAHPGIRVSPETFVRQLARGVDFGPADLDRRLRAFHAADLHLACACASAEPKALRVFDARFLAEIDRTTRTVDATTAFADEVRQLLREELLVSGKIADYSGRGPLAGWLRVIAVRRALNLRRSRQAARFEDDENAFEDVPSGTPDPQLDYLKKLYRREFREAFVSALGRLGREERNALRLHHLDGLTLDETASVCRVSRATVARWLAGAREQILQDTQRILREKLGLDESALASVFELVRSQLDVSMKRYLAEP